MVFFPSIADQLSTSKPSPKLTRANPPKNCAPFGLLTNFSVRPAELSPPLGVRSSLSQSAYKEVVRHRGLSIFSYPVFRLWRFPTRVRIKHFSRDSHFITPTHGMRSRCVNVWFFTFACINKYSTKCLAYTTSMLPLVAGKRLDLWNRLARLPSSRTLKTQLMNSASNPNCELMRDIFCYSRCTK